MLAVECLVGSGVDGSLCRNDGVISEQKSTLSRVDHLVALTADGGGNTDVSGVLILPANSQGMGAILEEDGIVLVTCSFDTIHVCDLSTHVRNKNVLAVGVFGKLLLQVGNIHDVVVVRFDVHSLKQTIGAIENLQLWMVAVDV